MVWFHKSLSEAKNLLEKDYDIVRSILTEHLKDRIRGKINIDMKKAPEELQTYYKHILSVSNSLCDSPILYNLRRERMALELSYAIDSIKLFEVLMLELVKEGKFQE